MSFTSFEKNIQSQFGEDGVIEEIFRRIGCRNKICVEFGAWDGVHLSNTWNLWNRQGWAALLIEGDKEKFETLVNTCRSFKNVNTFQAYVAGSGSNSLEAILDTFKLPADIDLLSIDIDGNEYYIIKSLSRYLPRVIIAEYNPTIPPDREIIQAEGEYFGSSALSLLKLGQKKGYKLAHMTATNIFLVHQNDFYKLLIDEPSLESVFLKCNLTYLISSYDGKTFLAGNAAYTQFETIPSETRYPEIISENAGIRKVIVQLPEQSSSRMKWLKNAVKKTFIYSLWRYWKKQKETVKESADQKKEMKDWEKNGRPVPPPPLYKREELKKYATANGIKVFIETGTYLGETISYLKNVFDKLISIELGQKLYDNAKKKFSKDKHVQILQGDSGEILQNIINDISEPCLFWLDGHYSDGITAKGKSNTPVLKELEHIFNHTTEGHVILIDDARCFIGKDDYPTIEFLENYTRQKNKALQFSVKDDIIRIHK
jgi:hypothetical protein